jgi:hypothetical protein
MRMMSSMQVTATPAPAEAPAAPEEDQAEDPAAPTEYYHNY